jgi:hypothetical protein
MKPDLLVQGKRYTYQSKTVTYCYRYSVQFSRFVFFGRNYWLTLPLRIVENDVSEKT